MKQVTWEGMSIEDNEILVTSIEDNVSSSVLLFLHVCETKRGLNCGDFTCVLPYQVPWHEGLLKMINTCVMSAVCPHISTTIYLASRHHFVFMC